jgi:hypothetical protein
MRWNLAIGVLLGFVLALALAFSGPMMHEPVVSPAPQTSN